MTAPPAPRGHAHHEALPGYSPAQILHDGCPECEQRGQHPAVAMAHLDNGTFRQAWERAAQAVTGGLEDEAAAETRLLDWLGAVQVKLQSACGLPLGELPRTDAS